VLVRLGGKNLHEIFEVSEKMPVWSTVYHDYDVLFYHHPWTNNVEIAFGTLSSFLIYRLSAQSG